MTDHVKRTGSHTANHVAMATALWSVVHAGRRSSFSFANKSNFTLLREETGDRCLFLYCSCNEEMIYAVSAVIIYQTCAADMESVFVGGVCTSKQKAGRKECYGYCSECCFCSCEKY